MNIKHIGNFLDRLKETPDGLYHVVEPQAMLPVSNKLGSNVNGVVLASFAGVTNPISAFITYVSGTNQMTAVQVPAGFRGLIVLIPSGAFTGATGGAYASDGVTDTIPIGKAFTAVAQRALILVIDGLLAYPIA